MAPNKGSLSGLKGNGTNLGVSRKPRPALLGRLAHLLGTQAGGAGAAG